MVELPLRLTLVALLLRPVGQDELRVAFLALAAAGLLVPSWLRRPALWLALAGLAAFRVAADWPLSDNHAYLLAYWCLAAGVALRAPAPSEALAWQARWLVGLVFAFASLWKLALSPDFGSGDFMRFIWIVDDRFAAPARWLGAMTPELLEANRAFLAGAPDAPASLVLPVAFRWVTGLATAWTLLLETAVCVSFLWRRPRLLARHRDWLLLAFCITTYAIAPVAGFGSLLLAMGLAQSEAPGRWLRGAYLATFAAVWLFSSASGFAG